MRVITRNFIKHMKYQRVSRLDRMFIKEYNTITPTYNIKEICNKDNQERILNNIKIRKGVGDILLVQKLFDDLKTAPAVERSSLYEQFLKELSKIPNDTHPEAMNNNVDPKVVKLINAKPEFDFDVLELGDIGKKMNILRTDNLGALTGSRSYVLMENLAQLERALIQYATGILIQNNFKLVSVPDILPSSIIEACGMSVHGERNQIYRLSDVHGQNLCLSGTSEISLAGLLANSTINVDKPEKLAAISRCYRAETSSVAQEKGIYRVHQFTKVEMFVCSHPEESANVLEEIVKIQEQIFSPLGIHLRQLDMPAHELGAPAYRKYDMEAWMPGRKMWGEISSCSNCTDYQSRRLNIKYEDKKQDECFVHTLNGTACAIPRLLIALLETHQNKDGTIGIPRILVPFMNGCDQIKRKKKIPDIKLVKNIQKI